ncbi:MAG: CHAT domain-containing protein [Clostridiales bacterium]|nr:CHAT domain-containing protein [Clostridiales bacterium]
MYGRFRRATGFLLAACMLSAGLVFPAAGEAVDGVRVNRALLVGEDDFVSRPSAYPSSTNNVFAMQEALQYSRDPFEAIMIPDGPVTGTQGLTAMIRDTFSAADADDVSYLYLSTHGVYDAQDAGQAALLLSDGRTESRMTAAELEAAFDGIGGTKVLILDACYSGAFIGKGMRRQPDAICFQREDFKVLTSSGALEESWYWNATEPTASDAAQAPQGAFYFTQTLSQGLSPRSGYPADENRDGDVTLRELYHYLTENHAASTPQAYPQEDEFTVFSYNTQDALPDTSLRSPIGDVTFSSSTLSLTDRRLTLEYIALRPVRVAYQIVNRRDGQWRFDEAQLIYDDVEQYTAYGDERGAVSPGRKVRTLTLNPQNGEASGYVLVQMVSIDQGKLTVHAGRVIAIPPETGELGLSVETVDRFVAGGPREMEIFVAHACPCLLSVVIENEAGETVRTLCHRQSTRPMCIDPEGSVFYWNGLDKNGAVAAAGQYRVRVTGYLGEQSFAAVSAPVALTAAAR